MANMIETAIAAGIFNSLVTVIPPGKRFYIYPQLSEWKELSTLIFSTEIYPTGTLYV